jgi:hypothetical protein
MSGKWLLLLLAPLLAALPASNNYQLNSYGIGSGGTAGSSSSNYSINGIAGETAGHGTSAAYQVGAGETYEKQANVSTVTLVNGANWYNKLLLTINPSGNPSDALFGVAISTDNFTSTQYVKNDFDSPQKVWVSLDTNGESGGKVYVDGLNAGLRSTTDNYTISSSTADLTSLAEGFGAQASSATQTSGGPFTATSPYNGSGQNVGIIDAVIREIFSAPAPVTAGRASLILKAKTKALTPAAADYAELLTAIASASF